MLENSVKFVAGAPMLVQLMLYRMGPRPMRYTTGQTSQALRNGRLTLSLVFNSGQTKTLIARSVFGSAHTILIFQKRWRVSGGGWRVLVFVDSHFGLRTGSHLGGVLIPLTGGEQDRENDILRMGPVYAKRLALRRRAPKWEV